MKNITQWNWIKMKNPLLCLTLIISFFLLFPLSVKAEELGTLMVTKEEVSVKETADASAKEVFLLKKGDSVLVMETTEDGWCSVMREGKAGYVESSMLQEQTNEKLQEELKFLASESEKDINAVNQYREEASRSKIWGIVIVVLIVAIFAVGIYTTVKNKKDE